MIITRQFSKVSRKKKIVVRDTENPRNGASLETKSSYNSGPGWSESSSSSSYSSSYVKSFSKKSSEDTKVYMPGGSRKIKDLSNKQLENIVKFEEPKSQKNVKNNSLKQIAALGTVPATVGYVGLKVIKNPNAEKIALGTSLAGTIAGAGIAQCGYMHHKKEVQAAKEELERRKKNN